MDGIFTHDELEADQAAPDAELTPQEPAEQGGQDRPRGPDGKFLPTKDGAAAEGAAETEGKDRGGTVPQGALHAEREKRKGSDERAAKAEAELASLREQLGNIQKLRDEVAARKPEDLPAADDPAALDHLRRRIEETQQTVTRVTQHMDDQALGQQELAQLGGYMQQSEARFREEKPDYDAAIQHVVEARAKELSYYGLTPPQIQQAISDEATEIVRSAVAQGRNPAELGYQIALTRGYRPAEGSGPQNGAEAKPTGANAVLDAIEKAKSQGKSLGSGGGSAVKTLTAEAVAGLSADEFDAIYSTPEGKAMIDAL
jgi:hypothetical protein